MDSEIRPTFARSEYRSVRAGLPENRNATGMDRIRAVRESLTKWESLPCVRRLDERLYDWNTTVSALTG